MRIPPFQKDRRAFPIPPQSAPVTMVDEKRPSPLAIIYRSELDYISRCILDYPAIETGGQLFGLWSTEGIPVVLYALGPGRHANHQTAFFNQDMDYLVTVGNLLIRRYGLQHIGEWHSHHQLGLAKPSGHDAYTITSSMQVRSLRRFLLCIGNCNAESSTLNAFCFHESLSGGYTHAAWDVKEGISPFRPLVDEELHQHLVHPSTPQARHGRMNIANSSGSRMSSPQYERGYWLQNKENNMVLKRILDFLGEELPNSTTRACLNSEKHVTVNVKGDSGEWRVYFPSKFPDVPPDCTYTPNVVSASPFAAVNATNALPYTDKVCADSFSEGIPVASEQQPSGNSLATAPEWNFRGDIYQAFADYFRRKRELIATNVPNIR